jgi:hypothetical protein
VSSTKSFTVVHSNPRDGEPILFRAKTFATDGETLLPHPPVGASGPRGAGAKIPPLGGEQPAGAVALRESRNQQEREGRERQMKTSSSWYGSRSR